MNPPPQVMRALLDRLPADHSGVLRAGPDASHLRATCVTDPSWLAEQIRLRGLIWRIDDQKVLATLWWYSASTVLVTPALAALVATGTALSPRLQDTVLHHTPSSRFTGSHATAILGPDIDELGGALQTTLATAITALDVFTAGRQRPLWAIATDAIANRLLWAGQGLGTVREATRLAAPIIAAAGPQLPPPRYIDVEPAAPGAVADAVRPVPTSRRFVRRTSCCLLYRVPDQGMCTSCPARAPAERAELLRAAAAR